VRPLSLITPSPTVACANVSSSASVSSSSIPSRRVLVPIGDGSEEIEATCAIDTMRRAGATVVVASVEQHKTIIGSRNIRIGTRTTRMHTKNNVYVPLINYIEADMLVSDAIASGAFDGIFLPGGLGGARRLAESTILIDALRRHG
jgi:4-methyl-5(b-hydroxyethyl)-thiazole monophosphate biosynthesis